MPRNIELNKVLETTQRQKVTLVAVYNGSFHMLEDVDENQFKRIKTVFIVACAKHIYAYTEQDPEAGRMSTATLFRRIEKSFSLCALCARESGEINKGVGHIGARTHQAILSHPMASKLQVSTMPARGSMKDKEFKLDLRCVECGTPHTKTVADVINGDRLKHGFALCKSCSQGMSNGHWKYTLEDVEKAAAELGIKLLSVTTRKQSLVPAKDDMATKVSCGFSCEVTCEYIGHQKHWKKTVSVPTLLYGATGCPYCAGVINHFEMMTYAIVRQFVPESDIQLYTRPHWLGGQHLDLYLDKYQLAIEVDGPQHSDPNAYYYHPKNQERDARKNEILKEQGIKLIRLDLTSLKDNARVGSGQNKLSAVISSFLPTLAKGAPDVFTLPKGNNRSKNAFQKAIYECYTALNREFIPEMYGQKKRVFVEFCDKVGITVLGEYVNDFTEIEVWCPHEEVRARRPADIMAGMGQYCCRVSAKGTKATVRRAIELAAGKGYLVDFRRSPNDLNDETIRATTRFSTTCLCGSNYSDATSINTLQRNTHKRCICTDLNEKNTAKILACYELRNGVWSYRLGVLKPWLEQAIYEREKSESKAFEAKKKLIELSLKITSNNRQFMVQLLRSKGYKLTEGQVRTIWRELKLRNKQRQVKLRPLDYYFQQLKQIENGAPKARPLFFD